MSEEIKHCNTCEHSYYQTVQNAYISDGVKTQFCRSADYNSDDYTHEMLMEDWDKGYCRFWTPRKGKDGIS